MEQDHLDHGALARDRRLRVDPHDHGHLHQHLGSRNPEARLCREDLLEQRGERQHAHQRGLGVVQPEFDEFGWFVHARVAGFGGCVWNQSGHRDVVERAGEAFIKELVPAESWTGCFNYILSFISALY